MSEWSSMSQRVDPVSFYISHVSLVHLFWAQHDSSVTTLISRPWRRGSMRYDFFLNGSIYFFVKQKEKLMMRMSQTNHKAL